MVPYFLTPTGNRSEGLALLGEYLEAQTYQGPGKWIIVDDCDPASYIPPTRFETEIIRPDWRWRNGQNTQADCLLAGLERIPGDAVVFVLEDDDAYLPEYVATMLAALESSDLVGESSARYYNVRTGRFKEMPTPRHSSLASTALRGTEALRNACKGRPKFIDIGLWHQFRGRKALLDTHNVVGIKGLPGRQGIGVGHRATFGDPDTAGVLRQWAGAYADNYDIFRTAT